MMHRTIVLLAGTCLLLTFGSQPAHAQENVARLLHTGGFGVPNSPAFQLLPGRPDEVATPLTASDLSARLLQWYDGTRVNAGAALDVRPAVLWGPGSLAKYQASWWRPILARTVVSLGTAASAEDSPDVLAAGGVRIPMIDRGDLRKRADVIREIEAAYTTRQEYLHQHIDPNPALPAGVREALLDLIHENAWAEAQKRRDQFAKASWNAFKFDVGVAGAVRIVEGAVRREAFAANSGGAWVATALPVFRCCQLTFGGKRLYIDADSAMERSRTTVGSSLRVFARDNVAVIGEFARIDAQFANAPELADDWLHVAVAAEIHAPILKGWLGLGYGGELRRAQGSRNKLSFRYALYENRAIPR